MNSTTSAALVPVDRWVAHGEAVALAGFLAGYRGSTREAGVEVTPRRQRPCDFALRVGDRADTREFDLAGETDCQQPMRSAV
jgi:hypothetical protein